MFKLVTTFSLSFEDIFQDIPSDEVIIDYIISSYTLDIQLIRSFFYRKELQAHCGIPIKMKGDESWVHVHDLSRYNGIYHPKFVIITTPRIIRFIWTTANFVFPMIRPQVFKSSNIERSICKNDFYFITLPINQDKIDMVQRIVEREMEFREIEELISKHTINQLDSFNTKQCNDKLELNDTNKSSINEKREDTLDDVISLCSEFYNEEYPECNLSEFITFCTTYGITFKIPLQSYNWSDVPFKFILTFPEESKQGERSTFHRHGDWFRRNRIRITRMEVVSSTFVNMFNIFNSMPFVTNDITVHVPKNTFSGDSKKPETSCFMIQNDPAKNVYKYKVMELDNTYRYHIKRYHIESKEKEFLLLTSANFTSKAWNGCNVELGILFEFDKSELNGKKETRDDIPFHRALSEYFDSINCKRVIHPFLDDLRYGINVPLKGEVRPESKPMKEMDELVKQSLSVLHCTMSTRDEVTVPLNSWVLTQLPIIEDKMMKEPEKKRVDRVETSLHSNGDNGERVVVKKKDYHCK